MYPLLLKASEGLPLEMTATSNDQQPFRNGVVSFPFFHKAPACLPDITTFRTTAAKQWMVCPLSQHSEIIPSQCWYAVLSLPTFPFFACA